MLHHFPSRLWPLFGIVLLFGTGRTDAQQAGKQEPVTLRVVLPMADATLAIQGQPTKQTGSERTFVSPPLDPGKEYMYTLSALWEPNNYTKITRKRTIKVEAGKTVELNFGPETSLEGDDVVVRYVPTPQEVVEEMMKLGEVTKDDVVFEPGCGDGRIVVTAVKQFGAKRGVGIDLDPDRIKDSNATAKKAGVEDKIDFRLGDALKVDYSDATVVMLYMGNDFNLLLRPILEKSLKPGSRIVSHRFIMGDWKPDKTITVTDKEGKTEYKLHLWKIGEKK